MTFNLITKPMSHVPNVPNIMKQSEVFVLVTRTESWQRALGSVKLMVQTYLNPGLSIIQHNMVEHNMET